MIEWNKYFDHIWCLHYIPYTDRYEHCIKELGRLGILNSGIFELKLTYQNYLQKKIAEANSFNFSPLMKQLVINNKMHGLLNVSIAHYEIIKESLARGFNKILILEDDNIYLSNLVDIYNSLENMPDDYDMCMLSKNNNTLSKEEFINYTENNQVNDYFSKLSNHFTGFNCIALSNRFMQYYCKSQEECFRQADFPCDDNVNNGFNCYYAKKSVCIQEAFKTGCMGGYNNEQIKQLKDSDRKHVGDNVDEYIKPTPNKKYKYTVVTFILGNYEILREPEYVDEDVEYICFTNVKGLHSNVWKFLFVEDKNGLSNRDLYYYLKYHYLQYCNGEYVLRIDGSLQIKKSLIPYFKKFEHSDKLMAFPLHYENDNCLTEYDAWIKCRGLNSKCKENYIETCKELDYKPETKGLVETCLMFCKNNDKSKEILNKAFDVFRQYNKGIDIVEQIWFTVALNLYYPDEDYMFLYKRQAYVSNALQICFHNSMHEWHPYDDYKNVTDNDLTLWFNDKQVKTELM